MKLHRSVSIITSYLPLEQMMEKLRFGTKVVGIAWRISISMSPQLLMLNSPIKIRFFPVV